MWNASQRTAWRSTPFRCRRNLRQYGITGEMLADDLTDRLATVRDIAGNNSITSSGDVRKDSTEDITVEIPETGVSWAQAWRYLRLWLGHERHWTAICASLATDYRADRRAGW